MDQVQRERLSDWVDRFDRCRVAVLGDVAADEYVVGRPVRISREAPVLILEYSEEFVRAGGAANTAVNLARLGASTALLATIGDDDAGRELRALLEAEKIDTGGLVIDPLRPTPRKTRVLARGFQQVQQQIVRIDRVSTENLHHEARDRLVANTCARLDSVDALVVSDYESGAISPEVIGTCLPEARARGLRVVVDSHGDLYRFHGVTAVTPNQPEAAATVGRELGTVDDVDRAGRELRSRMHAEAVLITRGSEGMALYHQSPDPLHLPASLADGAHVLDPNGAGDTVAAVFALAITVGAGYADAAVLANVAAGVVVRRLGAATVTGEELKAALLTAA